MKYINISFYKFCPINWLKPLQKKLLKICRDRNLKGTILLAKEGINCNVAGLPAPAEEFLKLTDEFLDLKATPIKKTSSAYPPFRRMYVKIREQLISCGNKSINPTKTEAPRISPTELKKWFDENKDFIILDTRNTYEIQLGTFKKAIDLNIAHFRNYEKSLSKLPDDYKSKPIVTFCTGGIRCEKAAPLMIKHGFKNVFQLDGGILNYFKQNGSKHYNGECFVFDDRVAVDGELNETDTQMCQKCGTPIPPGEVRTHKHV